MTLQLLSVDEGINLSSFDFLFPVVDPAKYKSYQLKLYNVSNETLAIGPQISVQFSKDGTTFDEGFNYQSSMAFHFVNQEPNAPAHRFFVGSPHRRIFLAMDNAEDANYGFSGVFEIQSAGLIDTLPVHTTMKGLGQRSQGPFAHILHGNYVGALGQGIKGLRIEYSPNAQGVTEKITGRAELWGYSEASVTPGSFQSEHFEISWLMESADSTIDIPLSFQPAALEFLIYYGNGLSATGFCDSTGPGHCGFDIAPGNRQRANGHGIVGASSASDFSLATVTPISTGVRIVKAKSGNPTGLLTVDGLAKG